jgi:hypothetical protein
VAQPAEAVIRNFKVFSKKKSAYILQKKKRKSNLFEKHKKHIMIIAELGFCINL